MEITYDQRKKLIEALEIGLCSNDIARPSTIVVWDDNELETELDRCEEVIMEALRILK